MREKDGKDGMSVDGKDKIMEKEKIIGGIT